MSDQTLTERRERDRREAEAAKLRAEADRLQRALSLCDLHAEFRDSHAYQTIVLPAAAKIRQGFVAGILSIPPEKFKEERDRVIHIELFVRELVAHAGKKDEYSAEIARISKVLAAAEASGRIAPRE